MITELLAAAVGGFLVPQDPTDEPAGGGENGAGKSNLLEALTIIFRNLDLELKAPFDYKLKYECRSAIFG